jgi:hypothetical protein
MFSSLREDIDWLKYRSRSPLTFPQDNTRNIGLIVTKLVKVKNGGENLQMVWIPLRNKVPLNRSPKIQRLHPKMCSMVLPDYITVIPDPGWSRPPKIALVCLSRYQNQVVGPTTGPPILLGRDDVLPERVHKNGNKFCNKNPISMILGSLESQQ